MLPIAAMGTVFQGSSSLSLERKQELPFPGLVHCEFKSNRDLCLPIAVDVSGRAGNDPRRLVATRDDAFFPGGVLVPSAGAPPNSNHVKLSVPVNIANLNLVCRRKVRIDHHPIEFLRTGGRARETEPQRSKKQAASDTRLSGRHGLRLWFEICN